MKKISLILFVVVSLIFFRINFKLYSESYSTADVKEDILLQLNFLETELKESNLDMRMQRIFPEGLVLLMLCTEWHGASWLVLKENAIKEPTSTLTSLVHFFKMCLFYQGKCRVRFCIPVI